MNWTLRWFGPHDPVPLGHLRQVPGLDGVVTALADVPAGIAWSRGAGRGPRRSTGRARAPLARRREHPRERGDQDRRRGARRPRRRLGREPARGRRRGRDDGLLQLHAGLRLDAHRLRDAARRRLERDGVRRGGAAADRPDGRHAAPGSLGAGVHAGGAARRAGPLRRHRRSAPPRAPGRLPARRGAGRRSARGAARDPPGRPAVVHLRAAAHRRTTPPGSGGSWPRSTAPPTR